MHSDGIRIYDLHTCKIFAHGGSGNPRTKLSFFHHSLYSIKAACTKIVGDAIPNLATRGSVTADLTWMSENTWKYLTHRY